MKKLVILATATIAVVTAPAAIADDRSLLEITQRYKRLVERAVALSVRRAFERPGVVRPTKPAQDPTLRFLSEIRRAAMAHDLPIPLIVAMVAVESRGQPHAVSPAGARGLLQVMPATGQDLGVEPDALFHPGRNIEAGSGYMRMMLDRYDGHIDSALGAYNWGPGNIDSGRPPPRETRQYIRDVRHQYRRYHALLCRDRADEC
jgi:soluble lytic murein transglycosylase-like protein